MAVRFTIPTDGGSEETVTAMVRRGIVILTLVGIVTFLSGSSVAHSAPTSQVSPTSSGTVQPATTLPSSAVIQSKSFMGLLALDLDQLLQMRDNHDPHCYGLSSYYNELLAQLSGTVCGRSLIAAYRLVRVDC